MNTRDKIVLRGDNLIRRVGYNAFSFGDISKELSIKNASIHYYFPTKSALVMAIIQKHTLLLEKFKGYVRNDEPLEKINKFLTVYKMARFGGRISILGALANDFLNFDFDVQTELKILTDNTVNWLTDTLIEGQKTGVFHFNIPAKNKALILITNILGGEQLSRITYQSDFQQIKETIISDLIK
ncbi:TetR/AcrR family transcriptional regulator [Sphingobacterium rhinopitheci]|uniref:TetR/AcrR family transcriptional regulator n=1 Tax=Sphingobacterium rhinopitheci TaxID=2781960 RepID=UPI001F524913|nr:TetR/AcrR family transcriptional regulator [Sphingobacterium rhinopitheci]MCI0921546.1 TetR/AcrR family transcriptional regulator [Sphingobacterium rhinopitheci]